MTGCAGTDAPVKALQKLLPSTCIDHVASIDVWEDSFRFIQANMRPQHFFSDIDVLDAAGGHACRLHGDPDCANVFEEDIDIFVCGPPCKPFSQHNIANFLRSARAKFKHPQAKPFLKIMRLLHEGTLSPRVIVIENVKGMAKKKKGATSTCLDFILRGSRVENGKVVHYGLEHVTRYAWHVFVVRSDSFHLPHKRERLYILGIRRDGDDTDDLMHRVIGMVESQCGVRRPGTLSSVLLPDEEAAKFQKAGLGGRKPGRAPSQAVLNKFDKFRQSRGFPCRDSKRGQPYSNTLPKSKRKDLGQRRLELLDIAALSMGSPSSLPQDMVQDLSQNLSRRAWKHGGRITTPTTSTELFLLNKRRPAVAPELFQAQGWPADELDLSGIRPSLWRVLVGNMMSVPCVGCILCAVLAVVPMGSDVVKLVQPHDSLRPVSTSSSSTTG